MYGLGELEQACLLPTPCFMFHHWSSVTPFDVPVPGTRSEKTWRQIRFEDILDTAEVGQGGKCRGTGVSSKASCTIVCKRWQNSSSSRFIARQFCPRHGTPRKIRALTELSITNSGWGGDAAQYPHRHTFRQCAPSKRSGRVAWVILSTTRLLILQ